MRYLPIVAISFLVVGCDQLTATVSAGSLLTQTPDLANAEAMPAGLAQALPLGDLQLKAGVSVLVAAGERTSSTSTAAPEPIVDAQVILAWTDKQISVCTVATAGAEGTYQSSNIANPSDCGNPLLEYVEEETYITRIETGSDLYSLSVTAPVPIAAPFVVLSPLTAAADHFGASLPSHPRTTALSVDWGADPDLGERHAFVTLGRIRYIGGAGDALLASSWQADPEPVWDNFPRTASEMIEVVGSDPTTDATIEASSFDVTGAYILVITTTEISDVVSTNLFLGSNALAGAGTAFIFWVD
ncbi:MAG: hypothetical protein A2289_06130 [Deltaproteobacteria bacterium RIFOXYA12_FULL_58_15]|nr:MAG: hypothetical protein A2289_06130 [Deltaproteobacteria bacterium RIFOXYA12_FULL_58_15]OGR09231.1 MAG: hypothetical protein A2341_23685 [Deltaproteobacteria bacterium RIFOXYB12_FULL_58_9]